MDPTQPLSVTINLNSFLDTVKITATDGAQIGGGAQHKQVYLWTLFFKIDGDTVSVNASLNLEGNATVVPTSGNHGDLGRTDQFTDNEAGVKISIPAHLGQFRTILQPIPLKVPIAGINSVPGNVGCVVVLLADGGLPDDAVAKGHDAFDSTFHSQLDQIIPTLGPAKKEPSPDDIKSMTQAISDAVESAIQGNVNFWHKIFALLFDRDQPIDQALLKFSGDDLAKAPATGLPIRNLFTTGGAGQATDPDGKPVAEVSVTEFYELNGSVFCHQTDAALSRFLQSQRMVASPGIKALMLPRFSSVRSWMASAVW